MKKALTLPVLIAALGYFVDMFDLTIFGVVRVASLQGIGITDPVEITKQGIYLINVGALGMLIGGLVWGVLGDRKGRLSTLFGSIILYSVANILNGFVTDIHQYAILRFIAGVGLAGELGAAITLVSEILDDETRGYGTTIIATLGLLGAVTASLVGQIFSWQTTYIIGGVMGLMLLLARFKMTDSELFHKAGQNKNRGDLRLLLRWPILIKYLRCVALGVPIYFITGILFTFAPEISSGLGLIGITAGNALLLGSIGLTIGDLLNGLGSQFFKSRKKAVRWALFFGLALVYGYLFFAKNNLAFYACCMLLGIAAGYWATLVTMTAEQFGTNFRATAATSVPNFVRASVIILTTAFAYLKAQTGSIWAAALVGTLVFILAMYVLNKMKETYGESLDFLEERPN